MCAHPALALTRCEWASREENLKNLITGKVGRTRGLGTHVGVVGGDGFVQQMVLRVTVILEHLRQGG